jgi:hypothetical protein
MEKLLQPSGSTERPFDVHQFRSRYYRTIRFADQVWRRSGSKFRENSILTSLASTRKRL